MTTPREPGEKSAKTKALQCETLDLGLDGFRECPQIGPTACEYALPFGYGFLCRHPGLGTSRRQARAGHSVDPVAIHKQPA